MPSSSSKVSKAQGVSRGHPLPRCGRRGNAASPDPIPDGASLRIATRIRAWGELLDRLGWCVVVDLPDRRGGWVGNAAREWISLHARDETVSDTISRDRMTFLREMIPVEQIRISTQGLLVWSSAHTSPESTPVGNTPLPPLSAREREILGWTREGKTSGEIAVILGRATRTIEKHLENIYRKLGVRSRSSLILRARHAPSQRQADV